MPERGDNPECVVPVLYSSLRAAVHTMVHDRYYLTLFLDGDITLDTIGVVGRAEKWSGMWCILDWMMDGIDGYYADDIRHRLVNLNPLSESNKDLYQKAMEKAKVIK